ncbi:cation diffusion facilitator family transporter [Longimicrobium sp.]|uniref:cation diffusion facilitator family transporter n=1 Tax=Longimicrobium sp. TaxID=2029185 RepID=UPI002E34DE3A|nr:cation diffusion facilitator family transporter [Longimicrobium sp.]HEX6040916.1 cation diffusion facilitator family transporter [Longimicrobium sp.]
MSAARDALDARSREVGRVLRRMLVVSLVLVGGKTAAGLASGSLAVLGGAFDSALDVMTTVVAILLARVAGKEPDEDHPYGHEKFEALGALAMVAFLSITVYELVRTAIGRIGGPPDAPVDTWLGVAVMGGSLVLGIGASEYERRRGKALESELLLADAAHLRADVFVTLAVLAGLLLTKLGWRDGDAWTALLVAVLIIRTGVHIIRETVPVLVDEAAVDSNEIRRMAEAMDGVDAAYDVRSRGRAGARFAELTIAVKGGLDVETAHEIADLVEDEVCRRLGARQVVVHVEPRSAAPPRLLDPPRTEPAS